MADSRTTESMKREFITCPDDVFTIKGHKNCISGSIVVALHNAGRQEHFYITLPNKLDAWKLLLKLDNMGGRSVFNQMGDDDPEPFKDSMPYKARFVKGFARR